MPHILNLGTVWRCVIIFMLWLCPPQYFQRRKQVENQKHVIITWHVIVYVAGTVVMLAFHVQKVPEKTFHYSHQWYGQRDTGPSKVYLDKWRYFINLTHVDDSGLDEHGLISIKGRYSSPYLIALRLKCTSTAPYIFMELCMIKLRTHLLVGLTSTHAIWVCTFYS